jgi:hypothetical protein
MILFLHHGKQSGERRNYGMKEKTVMKIGPEESFI